MSSPISNPNDPSKILPDHGATVIDVDGYGQRGIDKRLHRPSWSLVLRRTWADYFYQALGDRAATMTYFTVMAFAPTVLALYSIATLVFASRRSEVEELTSTMIDTYVPNQLAAQATSLVNSITGSASEGTWALVISVLISLFSASGYVRAFSRTANLVYGRLEGRSLVRTWGMMWALTIVLVVGLVVVLFANLLRDTVITGLIQPLARPLGLESFTEFMLGIFLPIWDWIRFPVTILIVLALIAMLYHYAPNVRPLRFRWITLGSVVALTISVIVWALFGLYLRFFAGASAYGAISTVMAVLVAVWVMNTALILGIKLDAEILRAKELQAGVDSKEVIHAPPRDDSAVEGQLKVRRELQAKSEELQQGTLADDA